MPATPEATVRRFIRRINAHDPEGLVRLCTPGHVFTDSLGSRLTGRAALLPAWQGYFSLFPNYRVRVARLFASGSIVAVFGSASGTLAGARDPSASSWSIPAAWRAVVRHGLLAQWQVFADNKPVYELLAGTRRSHPQEPFRPTLRRRGVGVSR
jgi:ketosteroid isomerase-like protein